MEMALNDHAGRLAASAHSEQAEAISLMFVQIERKDMVLFEALRLYGRTPRPVHDEKVELDFGLFAILRKACCEAERKSWSALLLGAAMRGDRDGLRMVEAMIYRRLAK
jgi:hypothetical protein